MITDEHVWNPAFEPVLTLGGGGGRVVIRTDITGTRHAVRIAGNPGEPLTVTGDGGEKGVIDTEDAMVLLSLHVMDAEFSATFPGLRPDGQGLTWPRCMVLERPDIRHAAGNTSLYRFTITLL